RTTKIAVNASSAAVILQVAWRLGQRTCFSSNHAPLKYPKNLLSGPKDMRRRSELVGFTILALGFLAAFLLSVALMRRTVGLLELFFAVATVFPKLNSLLLQTVKCSIHRHPS